MKKKLGRPLRYELIFDLSSSPSDLWSLFQAHNEIEDAAKHTSNTIEDNVNKLKNTMDNTVCDRSTVGQSMNDRSTRQSIKR